MLNLTPYILLLPLAGFVVLGLLGRSMPRRLISLIGCGVILVAFVLAVADFFSMLGQPAGARHSDTTLWTWMTSGTLSIQIGLLSDQLSAVMLLIVTGVGFLIHVYSIGYMEDDPGYWRFFSFLNLFVFAMALLVAADNFLLLLAGWAGVGLASFLLIGFWYTRPSAVAAARKAFVVNVIGDFGLMLAIFLLFASASRFNTLAYSDILTKSALSSVSSGTLTAIALLLFVAAAAKSAQLPLHVWLPDAMEGPTPVSALIHAATMVTAGVYLVARAAPLFSAAPNALPVVGIVGGASAFFAATIACVQTDIKRVLAYSTMSQLGYMFMGEAASGFSTGIFHLTTHAYFKALLFMSAGAVIHALGGEQDIRKMGGLRSKLPMTYLSFFAGGLALAAIFPFAGFWSKDAILGVLLAQAQAYPSGSLGTLWYVLYALGLVVAALTGLYTFRLFFTVFHGSYRGGEIAAAHGAAGSSTNGGRSGRRDPLANVHDVGLAMGVPMIILALLSFVGGFYGTPWANWIGDFLAPVTGTSPEPSGGYLWLNMALGLVAAVIGIGIAYGVYGRRQARFAPSRKPLHAFLEHRWYVDDLYDVVIVRPIVWLGGALRGGLEGGLDLSSRGVGGVVGLTSRGLRALQTGYVRNYAVAILVGAVLIVLYYVVHP